MQYLKGEKELGKLILEENGKRLSDFIKFLINFVFALCMTFGVWIIIFCLLASVFWLSHTNEFIIGIIVSFFFSIIITVLINKFVWEKKEITFREKTKISVIIIIINPDYS